MLRKQFADDATYRTYYPNIKKWVDYMWDRYSEGDLVLEDTYGDWCVAPEAGSEVIWTNDPARTTDGGLVPASYSSYCLTLMYNFDSFKAVIDEGELFGTRMHKDKEALHTRLDRRSVRK